MKKYSLLFLFVLSFMSVHTSVFGQTQASNLAEERIFLFTDRMIYIAGEQIHFSTMSSYSENGKNIEMSKVFYTELMSADGKKISTGKFKLENSSGSGCLTIPKDIISGNYFIRAYTKYMRNNGPKTYHYVALKIINPTNNNVLIAKNGKLSNDLHIVQDYESIEPFDLSIDKKEYKTRERVNVSLSNLNIKSDSIKSLCLTVVPIFSISRKSVLSSKVNNIRNLYFFPETRGITLTGKLIDKPTGKSLAYRTVNLSIMGDKKVFMPDITDSVGRFYFSLPETYGKKDIFMSTGSNESKEANILIDNDFCTKSIKLPSTIFSLTEQEHKVAYDFAVNHQIASHFKSSGKSDSNSVGSNHKPFYGNPTEVLLLDNYIKLPSLEEYFTELPSVVKVRKRNGKKYFKIYSNQASMSVYEPLVLIDGVAIDDPDRILAIPPHRILRVEVIDVPYIKGDQTYAGIISIISKKGDFAGVDLPESGLFVNFSFFADICTCDEQNILLKNHPDTRNTLLWKANIKLDRDKNNFAFFTTDTPGKYIILLRGISTDGHILSSSVEFEVKNSDNINR